MNYIVYILILLLFVLNVPTLFSIDWLQQKNSNGKENALFAKLAGEWTWTCTTKEKLTIQSYKGLFTLSQTRSLLLYEKDGADIDASITGIFSIETKQQLLRKLYLFQNARIIGGEMILAPSFFSQFGRIGLNGDVLWMTDTLQPVSVWHMVNHATIRVVRPGKSDPFDFIEPAVDCRWMRKNHDSETEEKRYPIGWLEKEQRILFLLGGIWNQLEKSEVENTKKASFGGKTVYFTSSRFCRRLLGECAESNRIHLLGLVENLKHQDYSYFFWYQIVETENPAKPDLIGMVGAVNPIGDTVLWKNNGEPAELWHFPDTNTVWRLTPAKDDPFDVKKGVLLSRWVREKKTETGTKP